MVLYRTRTHLLLPCSLILSGVLVLAAVSAAGFASAAGSGEPQPAGSQERLRELMIQRYETLKALVENSQRMLEMGRMDVPTFQSLTDAMYRAQADLRTTAAERVEVYEKLVEALTTQEKVLERQAESGRATGVQVAQGKLVTLNAQIDLERLRLGQAVPRP
jgi:hypothetical protein